MDNVCNEEFNDGDDDRLDSRSEHSDESSVTGPLAAIGDGTLSDQDQILEALVNNNYEEFRSLLRSPKVNPYWRYGKPHHSTLLEIAARRFYGERYVKLLLERVRPNVNKIVPEPLHYAAKSGNAEVLGLLLQDKRTKVNAHDAQGRTALHYACMNVDPRNINGYETCIRLLMRYFKPADINRTDVNGFSAIHSAVRNKINKNGSKSVYHDVNLEHGENLDVPEDEIWKARYSIIMIILDLGRDILDIDSERASGRTAREDLLKQFPELEKHLPAGSDILHIDPHSALVNSLRDGRIGMFKALLEQTDEDGNPRLDPNHWFGVPLHATCLELACKKRDGVEFVEALLKAGADPNVANKLDGKFPIHLACEKSLLSHLKALFDYSKATDPNSRDKFGDTALHYIIDRWSKSDRRSVIEVRNCLEYLLSKENTDVNHKNSSGKTALMLALKSKIKLVVDKIIEKKGSTLNLNLELEGKTVREMVVECFPGLESKLTSTQIEFQNQDNEWFHFLYNSQQDDFVAKLETSKPSNLSMNNNEFTLLQRAACYGMEKVVKSLLDIGTNPNDTFKGNKSPPAILAVCNKHYNVIKHFLNNTEFDVNNTDSKGNTVLYYASRNSDGFETVLQLLSHGADPNIHNKLGKICFDREKLQCMLDECVKTNGYNSRHEDYEIILDYRLLALTHKNKNADKSKEGENYKTVPGEEIINCEEVNDNKELSSEMDFLHIMSKNLELSPLLDHPVVTSFLQMKWDRVKCLAHVNLGIYVAFVLFLNLYIIHSVSVKSYFSQVIESELNDTNPSNSTRTILRASPVIIAIPLAIITLFLWLYLLLREIVQFSLDQKKYIGSYENYLDWSILMFSFVVVLMPVIQPDNQMLPFVNVISIMLSCAELLVLLGRISHFAKYIEMLKVVINSYIWPLMSYCVIIIAFGLSFHTLFSESRRPLSPEEINGNITNVENDINGFGSWYMSIITSLVMMTGELNFQSFSNHSLLSVILFVLFVLLVTIILLNLLIGLAVSDTQKIEADANKLRLKTRIEVVLYAESILVNLHNANCWIFRKLTTSRKLRQQLKGAVLFPGLTNEKRKGRVKPNQRARISLDEDSTEEHEVDREWLDQATQIISKRSGARAEPQITLSALKEQLDAIQKLLFTRGGHIESSRPRLVSLCEPEPTPDTGTGSVFVDAV